jgi:hypothetical protein
MIHEAQLNGSQKKAAEKIGECPGDWKQVDFFNYSTLLFWQVKYIVPSGQFDDAERSSEPGNRVRSFGHHLCETSGLWYQSIDVYSPPLKKSSALEALGIGGRIKQGRETSMNGQPAPPQNILRSFLDFFCRLDLTRLVRRRHRDIIGRDGDLM